MVQSIGAVCTVSRMDAGDVPCQDKGLKVIEVIRGCGLGGTERALARRIAIRPQGVSTEVWVLNCGELEVMGEIGRHVRVESIHRRASPRLIASRIAELKPDAVILHNPVAVIQLARHLHKANLNTVVVAHGTSVSDSRLRAAFLRFPLEYSNRFADMHIAVSQLAARGPWCRGAGTISVVPLGGGLDQAGPNDSVWPTGTRLRFLALGRMTRGKQLHKLIRAVRRDRAKLRGNLCHLAIVGEGPTRSRLERLIRRGDIADLVSVHDAVRTPSALLAAADWLLIASRSEGGPLTAYEGALSGVGIASTPVGVTPELLEDYPGGILAAGTSGSDVRRMVLTAMEHGQTTSSQRSERQRVAVRWKAERCSQLFYESVSQMVNERRATVRAVDSACRKIQIAQ